MSATAELEEAPAMDRMSVFMVILLLIITAVAFAPPALLLDLSEFYVPPQMLAAGNGAQIYVPDALFAMEKAILPNATTEVLYVPPVGLPILLPWAVVPVSMIRPIWWTFLLACVAASLLILQRAFKISQTVLVRLAAYVCVFAAEWEIMKHGQIAPMLLIGISLACLFFVRKKDVPAGLSLSLLYLKPQFLVPVVVFLLGVRRFRALGAIAASGAILAVFAWFLIGVDGFSNYSKLMAYSLEHRQWMAPEYGPTIRGQLLLMFPHADGPILQFSTACLLIALSYLLFLGHKFRNSQQWLELMMIVVFPIGILSSLHCHAYDLLLLIPAMAALIRMKFFMGKLSFAKVIVGIFALVFVVPAYAKIQYEYILHGAVLNPLFYLLILLCIAMVITAQRAASAPAGEKLETAPEAPA